jgi:hypothetical protein
MRTLGTFLTGFVAGWIVRSTVDSAHGLVVEAIAKGHELARRAGHALTLEQERLEDLWAEGRAQYEGTRTRAVRGPRTRAALGGGRAHRKAA